MIVTINILKQHNGKGLHHQAVYLNGSFVDQGLADVTNILDTISIGYRIRGYQRRAKDPAEFKNTFSLISPEELTGWDGKL